LAVAYQVAIPRPVDIHVNVLNDATKVYYGGNIVQRDTQTGQASVTATLPANAAEPLEWKVRSQIPSASGAGHQILLKTVIRICPALFRRVLGYVW
jgi:hypothetical protein